MMRAVRNKAELPLLIAQTRQFVTPLRVDFSEDVALPKQSSGGASCVEEWRAKKASTEQLMQLLQTYKDLGDSKAEPLLKNHNPRSFEDLTAPVPNFRTLNIKAGDVPKFFDAVLSARADEAVAAKNKWWAGRKEEATSAMTGKGAMPFPTLPMPSWALGKSVAVEGLKKVADATVQGLEPSRKLALPVVPPQLKEAITAFATSLGQGKAAPEVIDAISKALAEKAVVMENGKPVAGEFISKAVAAKVLATRRAEVHARYIKMWAKKLLITPELAAVPLKELDHQLASKFEAVAPRYSELLAAAAAGSKTLGKRMQSHPALDSFLLKRDKAAIADDFPPSEAEAEGAALAAKFEADPQAALAALLGPELDVLGSGSASLSAQVRAITAHKYTPDRYMYKQGMALAAKLEDEEAALKAQLKAVYGDAVNVATFQAQPRNPAQQLADKLKEQAARASELAAAQAAAPNEFAKYALAKQQAVTLDPSNLALDEVQYPALQEELLQLEMEELKTEEAKVDDAEEEELWMLTLGAQAKHIAKHFGVDLPHSVLAHMDPVLFKKIDWETTNGLEDWDITLDDMGAEYAKEQWGVESLSHHFLPLIRYRRAKARKLQGSFENEMC